MESVEKTFEQAATSESNWLTKFDELNLGADYDGFSGSVEVGVTTGIARITLKKADKTVVDYVALQQLGGVVSLSDASAIEQKTTFILDQFDLKS